MEEFGPFVNIVGIALALVATFSTLLLKMLGNINHWTWLSAGSPSFMVTAGARMVAIALMAVTYITIDQSNYLWFGAVAIFIGVFGFWAVLRFNHLQKLHIVAIPSIGTNGQQLRDKKNNLCYENVVIGLENQLRKEAKVALKNARKKKGGLSLRQFMAGYGAQKLNDPEALWDREILVRISNKMTVTLMHIILSAVMVLFLSAFVIDVSSIDHSQRTAQQDSAPARYSADAP